MPPPLPVESDAESIASEVPQSKPEPVEARADEVLEDAPAAAGEEEDDEDEGEEELYVVEEVLKHRDDFADNQMRYEIKWKGYPKKADRTWETEENLEGARDLLEAYWKKIGGKPEPTPIEPKNAGKKRGRQSTGTIQPTKKQRKGRKSASAAEDPDDEPAHPIGYTDVNPDTWEPPPPLDNAWEDHVMNVDTIEKDDKGELWAFLVWNQKNDDDRFNRSKARVFTNNKNSYTEENGITTE
ncbi:MAG: hypothetical protein Q9213_006628 [Squamulea squamosa]